MVRVGVRRKRRSAGGSVGGDVDEERSLDERLDLVGGGGAEEVGDVNDSALLWIEG